MHHIISDGWSMGLLVKEVGVLYQAFLAEESSPLAELPIQYADYAVWQREWLQGAVLEKQLEYWRQQLGGELPVLELPTDHARPAVQSYAGARQTLRLTAELSEQLRRLSRAEGVTLFMTLLGAFQVLLSRYSGQQEIVVGTPIANRNRKETEDLIGFFVNTLVLRTDLSGDPDFREVLQRVKEVSLGAYAHQDIPFEKLVEELNPERNLSQTPLFQVMLVLQNTPPAEFELPGLRLESFDEAEIGTAKFDLTVMLSEDVEAIAGTFEYNTELFEASTIERMMGHFERLLESIVADPETRVSELQLLSAAEERQLVEWNDTQREYPSSYSLQQLFEQQVERSPEAIALVYEAQQLSYAELNARANQLAHHLISLGVGAESLVGICLERSVEMVVGLLGILKAGGAYLPLDPAYPVERLRFMLSDAGVQVVITEQQLVDKLPAPPGTPVLALDGLGELLDGCSSRNPAVATEPENLGYVIYTSGSTGEPKGAMNSHRAIANRLLWMQDAFELSVSDRVLQKTSFSFDVSVWEFFWPLLTGARLVLARPGGHQDSSYLVRLIVEQQISTMHFVPSMLQVFLEELGVESCAGSLRLVVCSGEAMTLKLQEKFFEKLGGVALENLYGPTEAAVDVTRWQCRKDSELKCVPIGRPIANTQMYVLDERLRLVPAGVKGELYIGGVGLGRGYLNRPHLTAERFIAHPYSRERGERLYRTGDVGRYLEDGQIEYLGRLDHQVKVRGYRIELGEIETALRALSGIREAVVSTGADEEKRLVAYLVCEGGESGAPNVSELRRELRTHLPDYMIPAQFVILDELPLTPNGKVDRKSLPAPDGSRARLSVEYVAPRTETEEILLNMLKELLRVDAGVEDNFFDLGGHSLLATRLLAHVKEVFGVEVPLRQLFTEPTVAALATNIEELLIAEMEALSEIEAQSQLYQ
jgi:amino acid adenylation domain-containing protein